MTREEVFAAKRLVEDETFIQAVELQLASLSKQLFAATTPEDRERKFQEHSGLKRVVKDLKKQALEAKKFQAKT